MASIALEEKINKIRQQNEEIRRRYEEVEEDKKNAAKINALVQMVPSTDWPERKEPPEFSNPPRPKQKAPKEKHEYISQTHNADSKKGDGPPPDPKYNFLADSEREEVSMEQVRENTGPRTHSKVMRGNFRKRGSGRDGTQKDNRVHRGNYREEYQPGYEAWRAERNRIDEDRISRQRTAEGNWRREWDNDKIHIIDDATKTANRPTLGDFSKKDHKDFDRRYHGNGGDYSNHNRGGHRPYRGVSKHYHSNYENRSYNAYDQHKHNAQMSTKAPLSPTTPDERTVVATDKSLKVTVNQPSISKGPVMSVKVNLPSIAGTGRVGPRQRTRVTYSQSDVETPPEVESFSRQKSFDEKSRSSYFGNQKSPNIKRSQSQRMKKTESNSKSPYLQRKRDENDMNASKYHDNEFRSPYSQKSHSALKSPRATTLSGSENIDTTNLVQEEENPVSGNKSEDEVFLKEEEVNAVQTEGDKNGCELPKAIVHDDSKVNDIPIEDAKPLSPESDEINESTKNTDINIPLVENVTEQTPIQPVNKTPDMESDTQELGTSSEISIPTECNAKDDITVETVTQNDVKPSEENLSNIVEDLGGKCDDLSSNATNETPINSQTVNVTVSQNTNEQTQLEGVVSNSNENEIIASPKESEDLISINNCDSNTDTTVNEEGDNKVMEPDSMRSSEAEAYAVIESEEKTELSKPSKEENERNEITAGDSKERVDNNQATVKIADTMESTNTEQDGKVESQNQVLVDSQAEEKKPIDNS